MNETATPPKLPALQAGGQIRAIVPTDFESAWRIANAVVKAGMNPKGLETSEMCTIAIMQGLEVGMAPMMALQSIAIINKRPTIFGDGALGLCQGSGKMEWIKEWYGGDEGKDNYTAFCDVKRLGDPEVKHGKFSIADAKLAGLWGKGGPWTQYWRRMLQMRARAFALRDGFSDVLKGLGIAEEVRDIAPMRDITPPPDIDGVPNTPIPVVPGQPAKPDDIDDVLAKTMALAMVATADQGNGSPPDLDLDMGEPATTPSSAPQTAAGAPPALDGEIMPSQTKPSRTILDIAEEVLARQKNLVDLEIAFNDEIGPQLDPGDKEACASVYLILEKNEARIKEGR